MSLSSFISFFDPFGTVPGSSLNWSQHALLERGAGRRAVPGGPAIDTFGIIRELEYVGQSVDEVVRSVDRLVSDLGLRLDEQTKLLDQQVDLLAQIAQTLRNPARTRAAERLRDATELLRHHRNERALTVAEQAIDDDPNNDAAFILAGWAALGLDDLERARGYFREAAQATASERDQEARHMNAVYLAARLTFALEGPEAALRELDAARPFIDPELRARGPEPTREQLAVSQLSPEKAAAIKFDRAVYYTASQQPDAAVETFREITEVHNIRFCLMALTDPVLTANDAVTGLARDTLRVHQALLDEIRETLPLNEARWRALRAGMQQHDIRNREMAGAVTQYGELFDPNCDKRRVLDETWPWPPSMRWLEEFATLLRGIGRLESEIRPSIEREQMREAALEAGIQDDLRGHPKDRLVEHRRVAAVVGRRRLTGGYDLRLITVDDTGNVTVVRQHATSELIARFENSDGRYSRVLLPAHLLRAGILAAGRQPGLIRLRQASWTGLVEPEPDKHPGCA